METKIATAAPVSRPKLKTVYIVTNVGEVKWPRSRRLLDTYTLPLRQKIGIIRLGLSKKHLAELKAELELDYDQLSTMLGTSRATLINKKSSQLFDSKISEKILLFSDVLSHGREVFGSNENFNEWLKTPSEALGNVTPLSTMDTLYGIEEIKNELGRIAYGVY